MTEWRLIIGYEGWYEFSNSGKVKNVKTGKILKNELSSRGYYRVSLCRDGVVNRRAIHQLVMEAFGSPKTSSAHEINHKNGIKTDNRFENLEWVTKSENQRHAFKTGLHKKPDHNGENNPRAKLNDAKVRLIKKKLSEGESCASLSEEFNVSHAAIWLIDNGKTWKSVI